MNGGGEDNVTALYKTPAAATPMLSKRPEGWVMSFNTDAGGERLHYLVDDRFLCSLAGQIAGWCGDVLRRLRHEV